MVEYVYNPEGGIEVSGQARVPSDFIYMPVGGLEISGTIEHFLDYLFIPSGGLRTGGEAFVTFSSLLNYEFIPSGGLQNYGTAPWTFITTGGLLPNEDFTQGVINTFLYGRLTSRINNNYSRDSGPETLGLPSSVPFSTLYNLLWEPTTEEFILSSANSEQVLAIESEISNCDLTFDVFGRPVFVYVKNGDLFINHHDVDTGISINQLLDVGVDIAFVCLAQRFVVASENNNHIFVVYQKDSQVLYRTYTNNKYILPHSTYVSEGYLTNAKLNSLGVTPENKLQFHVVATLQEI